MRESMLRVSGLGLLIASVTLLTACGGDPEKETCGDGTLSAFEQCDDGNDADGDGCSSTCEVEAPTTETNCTNSSDDDRDGATDCADSDCAAASTCATPTEDCAATGDEDGDGSADCADSDCAAEPACATPEDCATPGDEDGDGSADCADTDCATADGCFEVCDDGVDNNGDGTSDCLDPTCSDAVVCESFCGDGVVDAGEGCDNGDANSDIDPDACRNNCQPAFCGDGVFDTGEQCDSGLANSDTEADACRTNCKLPVCGDGAVDFGEQCDSGADNSDTAADACRTSCRLPVCGDGAVDTGEGCDAGAENNDTAVDGCRTNCARSTCGDGVLDTGEACDAGAANSDTIPGACRTRCVLPYCGDGTVDAGESCDGGLENSDTVADACRTTCTPAACGDGVLDTGEACDAADENSDTAPDTCRTSCTLPVCGDGVQDAGEACDAGALNGDGGTNPCRTACLLPGCGDGIVDDGEQCDNGRDNADTTADACRTSCFLPSCGDGIQDSGEACDGGDTNSDTAPNACRTTCAIASCGDGIVDEFESCDAGAANSDTAVNGCRTTCNPAFCGDGVVDSGEACDAGAANSDTAADGCRTTCAVAACGDGVVDAGEQCDNGAANGSSDVCGEACVINHAIACDDTDLRDPANIDAPAGNRFLVSGNLIGSSDDVAGGCGANPGVEDVVVFVAPATGEFVARTAFLGTIADTSVRVLTDCGNIDSEIACGADSAAADPRGEATFSAVAGRAYYLLVEAEVGTEAPYLLEVAPVVVTSAPVIASASARYLTANNVQVSLSGSDSDQDLATVELYAIATIAGEGSGSGAVPPTTERSLVGTFASSGLSYGPTNGFSTSLELPAALGSTVTGLELVAVDAAGNRSEPFAFAAPGYTAPTAVVSGATCDPSQQLTVCTAPQACTRQSNATYICAAASAPSLASATATRVDLSTASVRLTGFDRNADVTRFRAEFYTVTNGRLGQIEGNLSATLLGQANYDVTFPLTGVNNFVGATQIRFVSIDQRGQVSNQLAAPLAGFADRTAGQNCDPAGLASRCAANLICAPKQDGGTACTAPSAPVFTGFAAEISEIGLASFGPVSGFDADGGLVTLGVEWNFAGGESFSEAYPLSGFTFLQSGTFEFEGAAPVSVTFTLTDEDGNTVDAPAIPVALPGDPGAPCDRAGTVCLANDYACGLGQYCEPTGAPLLTAFSFARSSSNAGLAELSGSDENGDIVQVRISALDQTGGPIVGLGWLFDVAQMSDAEFASILDVIGIETLRNGSTISATLIDRTGLESNTITIPLPGIVGVDGDCSDPAVAICDSSLDCSAGTCVEVNPFITSLTVSRTDSTSFTFALTGGDPNGDASLFLYTVIGPDGETVATGATASPDDHAALGGDFDVVVSRTIEGIPNGSTLSVLVIDAFGRGSAPAATDAIPLLVTTGSECANDATIDACETGAACISSLCLTDDPIFFSLSATRTSLDGAEATFSAGDALSNIDTIVYTVLDSDGETLAELDIDSVLQETPTPTFFKQLTGLAAYPAAAAIGVELQDSNGNSSFRSAAIAQAVASGATCDPSLDLCVSGTFCSSITGAPLCSTHDPVVTGLTINTAADLRSFTVSVDGFDADADIEKLQLTFSLNGDAPSTSTFTVLNGDFVQQTDGTVSFSTVVRWNTVTLSEFNLISAKLTDAASLTGEGELAYGAIAPLPPAADCEPLGLSCASGLFCDAGICAPDSAAACGTGVDVAALESGVESTPGSYQFAALTTPAGNTLGLGDCGSDGDETAILFAAGTGLWDVAVASSDAFFVSVVDGYCALTSPAVCEESADGEVLLQLSTSGESAKYLLIESAVAGSAATVSVTATRVTVCGDGVVAGSEACDDGNTSSGDGCDAICTVEVGFACNGAPSVCNTVCGDGIVAGSEACDDGNLSEGDGCAPFCFVELGAFCSGQPSVCQIP